ncbi:MAG: hypothetical protein IJE10_10910 [Clostridia bacterium]|nr:hypothetical protein [Clostridia bacterium]
MFKKALSMVLALVMVCTMIPAFTINAFAETVADDVYTEGIPYLRKMINGLDENGTPKNEPIALPDSFAFNAEPENATAADLPGDGELTYLLVASTNPSKSNFTGEMTSCNLNNPILQDTNAKGVRQTADVNATIIVPGNEPQEFQLVTIARSPYLSNYAGTVDVYIDGELEDDALGGGHVSANYMVDAGYDNGYTEYVHGDYWALNPRWDWGKTVTLEPGVHTVHIEVTNGSGAGFYGLILSTATGYDWTKITQLNNYYGGSQVNCTEFANTFGEAGLIDFTAPEAVSGVEVQARYTESTLTWAAISENVAYNDAYAYEVTVSGNGYEETLTVVGEEASFEGMPSDTEYTYTVSAMDMVGNKGNVATGTFSTLSAADSDEAYFDSDAEMSAFNVQTTGMTIAWSEALLGAEASGEIGYAVYVNDEYFGETTATSMEIIGLNAETEYEFKVIPTLNGAEGTFSVLTGRFLTGELTYSAVNAGPLLAFETANSGNGWSGNVTDSSLSAGAMRGRYWNSPDEAATIGEGAPCYFVGNNNSAEQSATVNLTEDGNYYVVIRTAVWKDGNDRHVEIKIDGTAVQANAVEGIKFGGWGGGNNEPVYSDYTMFNDYAETPVTLTAGTHTLSAKTKNGWIRIDYVGLVKEADYNNDNVANNEDIAWLLENVLNSKAGVMNFYGFGMMDAENVSMELNDANEIEVTWSPKETAEGNKDLTFELYINGRKTKTYDYQGRKHTYTMSTDPENGGIGIGDNVVKLVAKNGDEVLCTAEETFTFSAEDMTTAYFNGAVLETPYNKTTSYEDMAQALALDWTDAVSNSGAFNGSYNVYVNDELIANTTVSEYEITGLTPGTEYAIKIAIVENGEVLDSSVTALTGVFTTANIPKVSLASEADETQAVLQITDMFEAKDYEIALYSSAADWTLNDNGTVTLNKLLPGTKYEVTVKSTISSPYADEAVTYVHDKFSFTTAGEAVGEATYTSGLPIINGNLAKAQGKLGDDTSSPTNNGKWNYNSADSYKGIFGSAGVPMLYINAGNSVTLTVESPMELQLYLGAQLYCYAAGRYVDVSVNGTNVARLSATSMNERFVSDVPVTLHEGANEVTLTGGGAIVRFDHMVFIPAESKQEALNKYTAANTVDLLESSFGQPTAVISEANVKVTQLGTESILVNWIPNDVAKDMTVLYELTLNNGRPVVLRNNARRYIFSSEDGLKTGTNTLEFVATDEAGNEVVITKTIEIETLLQIQVSEVMDEQDTDLVDSVTITATNPTGTAKTVTIMAVVYKGNRAIEKHVKTVDLLLAETATFDLENHAKAIKPLMKLSSAQTQVKYFVLDMTNNAYLPLEINY